ncbi:MAG TPA: CYTH domain-containing protein [Epulopiscium sp.]|nr:CYTH domain-containing protein [Candidatus Epulonipiscium sp.]
MEIERKFLVNSLPELEKYKGKLVKQGYISTDPVIRIRKMSDLYTLTVKSKGHLIRREFELDLTLEQFDDLWKKVHNVYVSKTRYFIPLDPTHVAELDIYYENLEGLVTVEVEFDSMKDAESFIAPDWFGEDVTHDSRYKNNHLAIYGLPK